METIAVSPNSQAFAVSPDLIQVLSVEQFIEKCEEFNRAHPEFVMPEIRLATDCPVHIYSGMIGSHACKTVVEGYKECPICHKFMCPTCHSHSITVVSRVTGYISTVQDKYGSGWGNGKLAEFKDRKRHNITNSIH